MVRSPSPARVAVDALTGDLLVASSRSVQWCRSGRRMDVTPDHGVELIAADGGAIAMSGSGELTWRGSGGSVTVEVDTLSCLATHGPVVAAVTDDARLLVWHAITRAAMDGDRDVTADIGFVADGVTIDKGRRAAVWGWTADDVGVMAVFDLTTSPPAPVTPTSPWPTPAVGVAFTSEGRLAVGCADEIRIVAPDGTRHGGVALGGLEQLRGSADTVAWVRIGADDATPVAGFARVHNGSIEPVAEAALPDERSMPTIWVDPGGPVVVEAIDARLQLRRLSASGWEEPEVYDNAS